MMLRSRKNSSNMDGIQEATGPVKRHAAAVKDEPKRKRGGLSDLSNVMSNTLCIDSSKKIFDKPSKAVSKYRNGNLSCISAGDGKREIKKPNVKEVVQEQRLSPLCESSQENEEVIQVSQNEFQIEEEDPCPEYDYDAGNMGDPFLVPEYAFDIFRYYKQREKQFYIGNYSTRQPKLSKEMRAVLVDWMVDMQESFELNHETLYTAIKIMDLYLDRTTVILEKQDLQLMGSTSIFIASKFEERCPPPIDDFLYVCNESFTRDQMLIMERGILRTVGFDLGYPLAYRFLRRYAKVLRLDMPTLTLARFYLETCVLYYEFVPVSDSLMASACLLLALRVKGMGDWNSVLNKYAGYALSDVESLMWTINHAMIMRPKVFPRLLVAFNKYSSEVFFEVTSLPFLSDRFQPTDPVGPPAEVPFVKN